MHVIRFSVPALATGPPIVSDNCKIFFQEGRQFGHGSETTGTESAIYQDDSRTCTRFFKCYRRTVLRKSFIHVHFPTGFLYPPSTMVNIFPGSHVRSQLEFYPFGK